MVARHVTALRSLLERTGSVLDREIRIECKHFFSGAAAYANGRIFMTLTSVGLALKLSAESRESLIAEGARPLRYFPTGPVKKGYVVVPDRIAANPKLLGPWVAKSILFSQVAREAPGAKAEHGRRSTT
jgi:TfoX/Sxy family transcriptional regulator of competence genes